ncbi:putative monovalent cation/H+ antiporter subunit A [Maritalea mediterranea]|uniref:Monovalent cation/H+ antiporter subunit A n=1 Tax=Maritalea mediterranea TaxID=2909667 RepID=A0ABS9E7M2_9HYPH|nr:putative monovalent cation/H+ antiporter subunit A [Maritalea mediterranea]MCF4097904.1 putative monovalent cation/H+ antiporter subunit A [Maritalea mediterranea]
MSDLPNHYALLLIALAPFITALLAPWVNRFANGVSGWILATVPAAIFLVLATYIGPIADGGTVSFTMSWVESQYFHFPINLSFFVDGLSLIFALLISGIGTFIVTYSGGYLNGHRHQGRFLSFILMFMGSMLGLVLADNIITLFVFWELTSITSFLLIGFNHNKEASRRAAIQALVVTGGGGLLLLFGLLMIFAVSGHSELSTLMMDQNVLRDHPAYLLVLLLVLGGAFTKSAQVPFHFWLPNAMEAPTPVSAYLHSATMVKAGVYLIARMSPVLNDTIYWNTILPIFGGITLLTGAIMALRQTDMKQMLAYTTLGSLGMLVMLLGLSEKVAILAALLFLVAHAFYKGALFMVVGAIDHESGTRDLTEVSGLRAKLPFTFIAAVLAAISMAGFPISLGYFAKEEIYLLFGPENVWSMALVLVALIGNGLMMAVGLAIAIKPFFGKMLETPKSPHEAPLSMYWGPIILGVLGLAAGFYITDVGQIFFAPAATAVYAKLVETHLKLHFDALLIALSVATWVVGGLAFYKLESIRSFLRRVATVWRWGPDQGFDQFMFGLIRLADRVTRLLHHGRLELYLILVFVCLAGALFTPLIMQDALPKLPAFPNLHFYEWSIIAIAAIGLIAVIAAKTRLVAIVSLGIQGFSVAVIFLLFGAPDLGFTQLMVETLSVVILALVMTRLHLDQRDARVLEEAVRDGAIAIVCGFGFVAVLLAVLSVELDTSLSDLFVATSVPIAHGRNIVNVILVDYRALDTLGEITVVMTAGIAILALIGIRLGGPKRGIGAPKKAPKSGAPKRTTPRSKGARA